MNAPRQPAIAVTPTTSGGSIIPPRLDPLLHTPMARGRASAGTQGAVALANAGHAPASPTASRLRSIPRLRGPRTREVSIPAADHQLTDSVSPRPTPKRSSAHPAKGRAMAYEIGR